MCSARERSSPCDGSVRRAGENRAHSPAAGSGHSCKGSPFTRARRALGGSDVKVWWFCAWCCTVGRGWLQWTDSVASEAQVQCLVPPSTQSARRSSADVVKEILEVSNIISRSAFKTSLSSTFVEIPVPQVVLKLCWPERSSFCTRHARQYPDRPSSAEQEYAAKLNGTEVGITRFNADSQSSPCGPRLLHRALWN